MHWRYSVRMVGNPSLISLTKGLPVIRPEFSEGHAWKSLEKPPTVWVQ